jgi:hypothetical protein
VERGKFEQALPILQIAERAARGAPHPDAAEIRCIAMAMARAYEQLNRPQEAELWRARASQAATLPGTTPPATATSTAPAPPIMPATRQ